MENLAYTSTIYAWTSGYRSRESEPHWRNWVLIKLWKSDSLSEASPDGVGFYQRVGLERIGTWTVNTPDSAESVTLAVMRKHN
jgi:hypothetical protein